MPTYEYQCKSCDHRFETWQKMADDPLTTCPQCQGVLRRVFFPAGIVFKGSGFYKTDHANGKVVDENHQPNADANGNKEGADKSESGSEKKASSDNTKEKTSSEHGKETVSSKANEKKAPASVEAD